jgi:hypothetical protein
MESSEVADTSILPLARYSSVLDLSFATSRVTSVFSPATANT